MPAPKPWLFKAQDDGFRIRYTDESEPKRKDGGSMGLIRDITLPENHEDQLIKVSSCNNAIIIKT